MKLLLSIVYHPQTDGATERGNQIIKDMFEMLRKSAARQVGSLELALRGICIQQCTNSSYKGVAFLFHCTLRIVKPSTRTQSAGHRIPGWP